MLAEFGEVAQREESIPSKTKSHIHRIKANLNSTRKILVFRRFIDVSREFPRDILNILYCKIAEKRVLVNS